MKDILQIRNPSIWPPTSSTQKLFWNRTFKAKPSEMTADHFRPPPQWGTGLSSTQTSNVETCSKSINANIMNMTWFSKMTSTQRETINGFILVWEVFQRASLWSSELWIWVRDTHYLILGWNRVYSQWCGTRREKLDGLDRAWKYPTKKMEKLRGRAQINLCFSFALNISLCTRVILCTFRSPFRTVWRIWMHFSLLSSATRITTNISKSRTSQKLSVTTKLMLLNSPIQKSEVPRKWFG